MPPLRTLAAVFAAALASSLACALEAQQPAPSAMNHNLIVLDPAHGGTDGGARLDEHLLEKDATLAFAARLRTGLAGAGFTVVSTRESDAAEALSTDQRAETANRTHAVACIVLHVTGTGSGLHLYTSSVQPEDIPQPIDYGDGTPAPFVPTPWDKAQAPSVKQSQHLAADLAAAFSTARLPTLTTRVSMRPLDNLTCPAVAVELAPLRPSDGDAAAVTDAGYQQRVADAMVRALQFWRGHADPPPVHSTVTGDDFKNAVAPKAVIPKAATPKPVAPKPVAQPATEPAP